MSAASPKVQYFNSPGGKLGHAKFAVQKIAREAAAAAHTYQLRELATRIVRNVPSKDIRAEFAAVYCWVRDNIRYRFDPVNLEWIQSPEITLKLMSGDCDDMAGLISALLQALGHPVRYCVVYGAGGGHIYLEAFDGPAQEWVSIDPVLEPKQATTAPRADLGKFGRRLLTREQHYFSTEGKMIGFVPTEKQKQLWLFTPWQDPNFSQRRAAAPAEYRSPRAFGAKNLIAADRSSLGRADKHGRIPVRLHGVRGYLTPAPANLGDFWDDVASVAKAVAKPIASGVKSIVSSPITKVLFPVAAIANIKSPIQQAVVHALPGGSELQKAADTATKVVNKLATLKTTPAAPMPVTAAQIAALTNAAAAKLTAITKSPATFKATMLSLLAGGRLPSRRPNVQTFGALAPRISVSFGAAPDADIVQRAQAMIAAVKNFMAHSGNQPPQVKLPAVLAFEQADHTLATNDGGVYGPNAQAAAAYYLKVPASSLPPVAVPYRKYAVTWKPAAPAAAPKTAPKKAAAKPAAHKAAARPAPAPAKAPAKSNVIALPPPKPSSAPAAKPVSYWLDPSLQKSATRAAAAIKRAKAANGGKPPAERIAAVESFQALRNKLAKPQGFADMTVDGFYGPQTRAEFAKMMGVSPESLGATAYDTKAAPKVAPAKPSAAPAANVPAAAKAAAKPATKGGASKSTKAPAKAPAKGAAKVTVVPTPGMDPWASSPASSDLIDPWAAGGSKKSDGTNDTVLMFLLAYMVGRRKSRRRQREAA